MSDLISIIIPVYNVEDYLDKCLRSVLDQTYSELQIIVVDDGSTDSSAQICDNYKTKDSRVTVIHKNNGGLSSARNAGMDISKGVYCFFMDSDDYIDLNVIKRLHFEIIKNNGDIACCDNFKKRIWSGVKADDVDVYTAEKALEKICSNNGMDFNACGKLIRANLLSGLRFPEGRLYENIPVIYPILKRADIVINVRISGYHIVKRNGSITRCKFNKRDLDYMIFAKEIYDDVSENNVTLKKAAYAFYLYSVIFLMEKINRENKPEESIESQLVSKEFNEKYSYIIFSKNISVKKKLISLLIKLRLYHKLYSFFNQNDTGIAP